MNYEDKFSYYSRPFNIKCERMDDDDILYSLLVEKNNEIVDRVDNIKLDDLAIELSQLKNKHYGIG